MSSKVQVKNKKVSKDVIIEEILKIFPTLKHCADALGMSDSNFSHAITRRSNKFIFKLKDLGVKIPELDYGFTLEVKNKYVKEDQQQYKTLLEEITSLKSELSETKKLITLSVNRITELETENENLRAEVASLLEVNRGKGSKINGNQL